MSATETSFVLTNPETRIFSRTEGVYFIRLTLDDWWKSGGNTVELAMQKDTSARFVSYDVEKYSASGVAIPSTFLEDAGKIKVWIGQSKEGETRISSTAELTVEDSTGRPDGVTIAVKTPAGSDEGCIEKIRESGGQFQFYGTQGWTDIKTSDETDAALNGKVDKIAGKGLSTNDYTDAEKAEVAKVSGKVDKVSGKGLSTNDYTDSAKSFLEETVPEQIDRIDAKIAEVEANVYSNFKNKVDKVTGKGLSTNDFTTELKDKLDGVEEGANKTAVDAELSATSENPVQNKTVKAALDKKIDEPTSNGLVRKFMSGVYGTVGVDTTMPTSPTDNSVPTSKLVKTEIDKKLDKPDTNGGVLYINSFDQPGIKGIASSAATSDTSELATVKIVKDYINSLDAREVSY